MSTKGWILLFAALALLCIVCIAVQTLQAPGQEIVITQDGQELYRIDLSHVGAPYELRIEGFGGENILYISNETVRMASADCDGQDCVLHGPLAPEGAPIVCLPHRLVIRWAERRIDG